MALLRSSLGECTEAVSGHEVTAVSGRCWFESAWPKPTWAKLVLSESIWRADVKLVEVGSSRGFESALDPTTDERGPVKKDELEASAYGCEGAACAMDRLRAGDTPELLMCVLLAAPDSTHEGRVGRHSVSESATREPEPVLPSARS